MLSMDESEEAEVDHVPRGTVFISHQIQSHGDVWVTVVTTQVVLWKKQKVEINSHLFGLNNRTHPQNDSHHPVLVLLWGVVHRRVPGVGAAGVDFTNIQHPVPTVKERNKLCCCMQHMYKHRPLILLSFTYFVGLPKAMLSSCKKRKWLLLSTTSN